MSVHLRCDTCAREFTWGESYQWFALVPVRPTLSNAFGLVDQVNAHGTVCSGECALEWLCKQGRVVRYDDQYGASYHPAHGERTPAPPVEQDAREVLRLSREKKEGV